MTLAAFLYRYTNAAIECCWLVIAALVPLFIDLLRSQPATPKGLILQLLVLLMALLWLVQRLAAARAQVPPGPASRGVSWPLIGLALAYAGTTLLSAGLSPLPGMAFWGSYLRNEGALATTSYVVLFLIVADRLRDRAQFDRLVSVLLATTLVVCLYGVAQALHLDPMPWGHDISARIISTAGNALFLANYLLLVLPLTLWRLVQPRESAPSPALDFRGPAAVAGAVLLLAIVFVVSVGHAESWWAMPALIGAYALLVAWAPPFPSTPLGLRLRWLSYLGLLGLEGVVLLLTASIGPLAALIGAPLLVGAVAVARCRQWRQLLALGSVALFAAVFLAVLARPNSPLEPVKARVTLLQRLGAVGSTGAGPRGAVWRAGLQAITHLTSLGPDADPASSLRPVVGYGPETVTFVLNRVLPPPQDLDLVLGEFWDRSHNALLDRLLTTGLLGLAAYLGLLAGVLIVTLRRTAAELDARRLGPHLALALALLAHLLETQLSMLILPAEAIFWLLAAAAAGAPWDVAPVATEPATEPANALQTGRRRGRPRGGSPPAEQAPTWRWLPLAVYAAVVLVAALTLLSAAPIPQLREATMASLALLALGPFVAAYALVPGPRRRRGLGLTVGLAIPSIALMLLLGSHQVGALAADVAFKRAEGSHASGDFGSAILRTQEAIRLAPDQAEYYFVLGQYYAALGGRTHGLPVPGLEASLSEALTTGRATLLGRDQLFDLGRLSLEEAIRQIPLEARYHSTLGELYRFWSEVSGDSTYLTPALASFQRAAYLKPNDVEIYAGIADALLLRDDPARAVQAGTHARDLLPTYWYPYSVLARAYRMMNWDAVAYEAADAALSLARRDLGFKSATQYDLDQLREILDATRGAVS